MGDISLFTVILIALATPFAFCAALILMAVFFRGIVECIWAWKGTKTPVEDEEEL